ncbi:ATP-binding protein, partial [Myxococcota bacterium]|nr:ATP-binding protein [Myxococcota bacterium]
MDAGAFESLCCALAYASIPTPADFYRIDGRGGDGGVECVWTDPRTGEVHGWQAKYVPDLTRALKKSAESLATARARYPRLARFVICLPFDLAGSRGGTGKGKSEQDRFDDFKAKYEAEYTKAGQPLQIELWSDFILREHLRRIDPSGGRTRYWFDPSYLSSVWFSAHLDDAILYAGPRYSPRLHHGHALDETLAALGDTDGWRDRYASWRTWLQKAAHDWASAVARTGSNTWTGGFPTSALASGTALRDVLAALVDEFDAVELAVRLDTALEVAARCVDALAGDLDARFGKGASGSVRFRQMRAEVAADFPAAHLDESREILKLLQELNTWLAEPAVRAARERVLLLTGPAGIGKTHGLCDVAERRRAAGLHTLLVFGAQLSGPRTLWEELSAALGLDGSWSRDVLLDALDAAASNSPGRLLLCIDALDERAERQRWLNDLPALVDALRQRPRLAICMSVRDGYQRQVIRDDVTLPVFLHPGFGADVFDASAAFFTYYKLSPPVGPLLAPEMANPLFLKLLCETLIALGLTTIPPGWQGTRSVLRSLLQARDAEIAQERPALGNNAVSRALLALAAALPEGGTAAWRQADHVVNVSLPHSQQGKVDLLERMVGWGLLRRFPGESDGWAPPEDHVGIAFGRLRHHLLAERLTSPAEAPRREALRELALADPGLAEALSLVMPERGAGELPDLAEDPDERAELLAPWLAGLPWRAPESLGERVEELLNESFVDVELLQRAWD